MGNEIELLIIEDNPGDARLIMEMIREDDPGGFLITHTESLSDAKALLARSSFDIVLLDLNLLDSYGYGTFEQVRHTAPRTPIVILTGTRDDDMVIKSLREGGQDYLLKGKIDPEIITRTLKYAIQRNNLISNLAESEERFFKMINENADGILLVGTRGNVKFANPAAQKLLGRMERDILGSRFPYDIKPGKTMEFDTVDAEGNPINVEMTSVAIEWVNEMMILVSLRDITFRKNAAAKEAQYLRDLSFISRSSLELVQLSHRDNIYACMVDHISERIGGDAYVIVESYDPSTKQLKVESTNQLAGFKGALMKKLGGDPVGKAYRINEEAYGSFIDGKMNVVPGGVYSLFFGRVPKSVCTLVERSLNISKIYSIGISRSGELYGAVIMVQRKDGIGKKKGIIETYLNQASIALHRWQVERELTRSLEEKEILLKEVHHRVKNNLQLITSMLKLQSRTLNDPGAIEMLQESQNRIRSMAIVHEKLYSTGDMVNVDFSDYIRTITSFLFQTHEHASGGVDLVLDVERVHLKLDTAIPCGLIVNELVTNSLKHAFPKTRGKSTKKGKIEVSLKEKKDQMVMVVKDNGVGIKKGFDPKSANSLGLKIVENLSKQLDGQLSINRRGGTRFMLTFPK